MATTSAAARESRRRKLVDRGADRLALITGRIESLPPDSSNNPIADSSQPTISPDPPTHLADQRTVPSSINDEDFSSVLPNLAVAADTDDGGSGVEFPLRDIGISICSIDKEADALSETCDLCIGGDYFEMLQQSSAVLRVIPLQELLLSKKNLS